MLGAAVSAAGLDGCFDAVLSVEDIRAYKTDQRVYDLVTMHFRVYPDAVSFQSSTGGTSPAPAYSAFAPYGSTLRSARRVPRPASCAVLPSLEGLLRL
jgi:2-haloacid dehalogenase